MLENQTLAPESTTFAVSASGPDLKFQGTPPRRSGPTGRQISKLSAGIRLPITPSCTGWPRAILLSFGLNQTIDLRTHKDPRFIIAKS